MASSSLHGRALAKPLVLLVLAVMALTACNPLTLTPGRSALYTGPEGNWLEVSFSGLDAYDVSFAILAYNVGPPPRNWHRSCRDGVTGAVETCPGGGESYIEMTEYFVGSESFRATITPLDLDGLDTLVFCMPQGETERVPCPDSVRMTLRVVDEEGNPVGNLAPCREGYACRRPATTAPSGQADTRVAR